jgi:hypothetical protein
VGSLRVDRIQIILGPMDSARSLKGGEEEEDACVVLVIGLESGVSMDAGVRTVGMRLNHCVGSSDASHTPFVVRCVCI